MTKESANKEAGGSQHHLKGEYFEEPNTTQKDIKVEIETEKEKCDGTDQLLQLPSPPSSPTALKKNH